MYIYIYMYVYIFTYLQICTYIYIYIYAHMLYSRAHRESRSLVYTPSHIALRPDGSGFREFRL